MQVSIQLHELGWNVHQQPSRWCDFLAWNLATASVAAAGGRRAAQLIAGEARDVLIAIRDARQGFAKVDSAASDLLAAARTLGAK